MVAGIEIKIGGKPLDPALYGRLVEVRVDDNLRLPDSAVVRLADPALEQMDSTAFEIGGKLEIQLAPPDGSTLTTVFTGEIASLEPEFTSTGVILVARAYDGSHRLNLARRTQTYQNMTAADIARKVAQRAGLQAGTIDSAGAPADFVQQSGETDWDFLWRLASRIDFEVLVADGKLHFRRAAQGGEKPLTVRWGDDLLAFRPRVTGVQQPDEVIVRAWDPVGRRTIEASTKVDAGGVQIGIDRGRAVKGAGGGTVVVSDRPVASEDEARELARSVAAHLGNAYVEAEGVCRGNPRLRAGGAVTIDGVGNRFGGTFAVSSTTHQFRGTRGYQTLFTVAGRASRSLVELMTPAAPRSWTSSVAVGLVTQNDDPKGLGRIRVKYPALDESVEGWWARVASPGAGKDRGVLMMPCVGDEVLLAFEHGDVHRPYVLGALWNGSDTPGELVHTDGSLAAASDHEVSVKAKDDITVKGGKDLVVETDGKIREKAGSSFEVEGATQVTVKAGTSLKLEGSTEITISCGGASISLKTGGIVQISGTQIMLG